MTRLLLTVLALGGLAAPALAQQNTGNYNDTYGVLSERNMFNRERHKPRPFTPRNTQRPDTTSPQAVERSIVLRGVAIEEDELHAYLENTRTNKLIRIAPGEALASGHVPEIAIDAIAYEVDGRINWVEIGQNLSGARSAGESASAAPTTEPAVGGMPPMTPSPSASSLEERMKLRRLQQKGGK